MFTFSDETETFLHEFDDFTFDFDVFTQEAASLDVESACSKSSAAKRTISQAFDEYAEPISKRTEVSDLCVSLSEEDKLDLSDCLFDTAEEPIVYECLDNDCTETVVNSSVNSNSSQTMPSTVPDDCSGHVEDCFTAPDDCSVSELFNSLAGLLNDDSSCTEPQQPNSSFSSPTIFTVPKLSSPFAPVAYYVMPYHYKKPHLPDIPSISVKRNSVMNKKNTTCDFSPYYGWPCEMYSTPNKTPIPEKVLDMLNTQTEINSKPGRTLKPSNRCFLCQSLQLPCDSFPGNGRCSRCTKRGVFMPCVFTDRWYEYCEENPFNEYYFAVFPERMK